MSGPPSLNLQITSEYEEKFYDSFGDNTSVSFYRPKVSGKMCMLGDHAQALAHSPGAVGSTVVAEDDAELLASPRDYTKVWSTGGGGSGPFSIWAPLAPSGFVSLGCVASQEKPSLDQMRCVRWDVVSEVAPGPFIYYAVASGPVTVYQVPGLGTFQAQASIPVDLAEEGSSYKATPASVQTWVPKNL